MKKLNLIISVIAFLFIALFKVSAQEATFDYTKLNSLKRNAIEKLKDKKFRSVTVEEWFENESEIPVRVEKSVNEILSPASSRFICEKRPTNGIGRFEYISINGKMFVKYEKSKWKEYENIDNQVRGCEGVIRDIESQSKKFVKVETAIERRLKKDEIVNNQTADLYETISRQKYFYPSTIFHSISRESFWFDSSGRYVKTLVEFQDGETKKVFRRVTNYNYTPKIKKIEAPIIENETKSNPK